MLYFSALKNIIEESINRDTSTYRKHHNITQALQKLCAEVGFLSKRAINHTVNNSDIPSPATIYCAIKTISYQLVFNYTAYLREGNVIWREIYLLYQFAIEQKIQSTVFSEHHAKIPKTTVEDAFKQIITLKLIDPYQILARHIWQIYLFLQQTSSLIIIHNAKQVASLPGSYLIDMNNPGYFRHISSDTTYQTSQDYIVTAKLIKSISTFLQDNISEHPIFERVPKSMLKKMSTQLKSNIKRKLPRHSSSKRIKAAFGIEPIHYFLDQKKSSHTQEDNIDMSSYDTIEREHQLTNCRQVDQNVSGMCLEIETNKNKPSPPSPGELVYIEENTDQILAIICWTRRINNLRSQCGVQMIHGQVNPVNVKPIIVGRKINIMQPGLIINKNTTNPKLILEHGIHQDNCDYLIDNGNELQRVSSEQLRDSTNTFDYIDIRFHATTDLTVDPDSGLLF